MGTEPSIKVHYQGDITLDDVLKGMAKLDTSDLEVFMQKVSNMVAQRKAPHLAERETGLLTAINNVIHGDLQHRYEVLAEKQQKDLITPSEHTELLHLIEKLEFKLAERLGCLVELAHLRGVSLDEVSKQLNLQSLYKSIKPSF